MATIIYASNSKHKNDFINYLAKVDTSWCYFLFFFPFDLFPLKWMSVFKYMAFLIAVFSFMIRSELEAAFSSF